MQVQAEIEKCHTCKNSKGWWYPDPNDFYKQLWTGCPECAVCAACNDSGKIAYGGFVNGQYTSFLIDCPSCRRNQPNPQSKSTRVKVNHERAKLERELGWIGELESAPKQEDLRTYPDRMYDRSRDRRW